MYTIQDINIDISIPSDWYCADRYAKEENIILQLLHMSSIDFTNMLYEEDEYFLSASSNFDITLDLYSYTSLLEDFNLYNNTILLSIGKQKSIQYSQSGFSTIKTRIIGNEQKFIKLLRRYDTTGELSIMYITVIDGVEYDLLFSIIDDDLLFENEKILDEIVCGIRFHSMVEYEEYTIESLGMYISVPKDFKILNNEERYSLDPSLKYQFYSLSAESDFYVHVDLLDTETGVKNLNLMTIDELKVLEKSMADLFSLSSDFDNVSCSMVIFNDIPYFKIVAKMNMNGSTVCEVLFTTILNNKQIAISFDQMLDKNGNMIDLSEEYMNTIMNSIRYDYETLYYNDESEDTYVGFTTYKIEDPSLSINIPSQFNVFWRNMPSNAFSIFITGDSIDEWDNIFSSNPYLKLMADADNQTKTLSIFADYNVPMPEFKKAQEIELKRYIRSVASQQAIAGGNNISAYKLLSTNQYTFIIEKGEIADQETIYTVDAFTYYDGNFIKIQYCSQMEISEDEITDFIKILLSITIEDNHQEMLNESDWFTVNDILPITINCRNFRFLLPSYYLYWTQSTSENDLCLNAMGFSIESMTKDLKSRNVVLYAFPYSFSETVSIIENDAYGQEDFSNLDYQTLTLLESTIKKMYDGYNIYTIKNIEIYVSNGYSIYTDNRGLYSTTWIKVLLHNNLSNCDQLAFMSVIGDCEYIIFFEKNTINTLDEKHYTNIIDNIQTSFP